MKKLIVCLIVLAFAVTSESANMVVDGSFEFGSPAGWSYWNDEEVRGAWTAHGTFEVMNDSGGEVYGQNIPDVSNAVHIGTNASFNYLTQEISGFVVGETYEVTLASITYTSDYGTTGTVEVYNVAGAVDDLYEDFESSVNDPAVSTDFLYTTHQFVASNTDLRLYLINQTGSALTIDDISIVPQCTVVGTAVPVDPCGLVVYENAAQGPTTGAFTVVLDSSPGATDTITVDIDPNSNGDGVDVTVSLTQLTFTSADWDTAQTVTVTAIDDTWADGQTEVDSIGFTVTSSDPCDPCYADACISSVSVTIYDDDSDAIIVSKTSASVAEGGAGDSYTIELATTPTNPVTIIVAADYTETSPTDSNMVVVPFDCQLTVNGGGSDTLVFTQKEVPQTVNISVVDESMYEANPHLITIGNHVSTDDPIYSAISADDVVVSITENDFRGWSFGDDVLLSLPPNSSFETPTLSEGQSYVNSDPNYGPFGTLDIADSPLPISHISDPCWAVMYEVGQTVPDGDNVLVMPGNVEDIQYLSYTTRPCEYLIEPGPVSYTLTVAVGLPKEAGGSANPDAYAQLELWWYDGESYAEIASTGDVIGQLTPGEWQDITLCSVIPIDATEIGSTLSIELWGEHVQFDNVRLTVGNHPCDGCTIALDDEQLAMDFNGDCQVTLADFADFAADFLDCYLYPNCVTSW